MFMLPFRTLESHYGEPYMFCLALCFSSSFRFFFSFLPLLPFTDSFQTTMCWNNSVVMYWIMFCVSWFVTLVVSQIIYLRTCLEECLKPGVSNKWITIYRWTVKAVQVKSKKKKSNVNIIL